MEQDVQTSCAVSMETFKMQWDTGLKTWSEFSVHLPRRTWLDYRLHEVPSNLRDSVTVYYFQNYI